MAITNQGIALVWSLNYELPHSETTHKEPPISSITLLHPKAMSRMTTMPIGLQWPVRPQPKLYSLRIRRRLSCVTLHLKLTYMFLGCSCRPCGSHTVDCVAGWSESGSGVYIKLSLATLNRTQSIWTGCAVWYWWGACKLGDQVRRGCSI